MDTLNLVFAAQRHLEDKKLSIQELSGRINVSRTMLSQYLSGKYGSPETVEEKLLPYLVEQGALSASPSADAFVHNQPGERFFQSTDARGIAAICSLSQQYAILGVVVGKSGYGKTHTLKQYAGLPKVAYIECDDTMERRDMVDALESILGMNHGYGSICKRTDDIVRYLNSNPGYLIIVDEADKLISRSTHKKMELFRKLVDKSKVGVVIAGEPQLEPMLKSYDSRMANRGSYIYRLGGLAKNEVVDYLAAFPMAQAAKEVLTERACNNRNGCFRLLDRTLTNVIRLVRERNEDTITLELVREASDMMML